MNRTAAGLLVAAAVLGAGLAGAWFARRDADAERDALLARLAVLEQRATTSPPSPAAAGPTHRAVPNPASRPTPALREPDEQPLAQTPAERAIAEATLVQGLQRDYEHEPREAAWAAQAEHALTGAASAEEIANANLVPTAFESRCRSRRCRIVARFATRDQAQEWAYYFMTRTAGTLRQVQFFIADAPGGGAEITLYGQR
jgi:hypothetical protein